MKTNVVIRLVPVSVAGSVSLPVLEDTGDLMDEVFWARIYANFHFYHSLKVGRDMEEVSPRCGSSIFVRATRSSVDFSQFSTRSSRRTLTGLFRCTLQPFSSWLVREVLALCRQIYQNDVGNVP